MPCPKRKASRARRDKRSANKGLDVQTFTTCPNSGIPVMPHTVCLESGYYKGVKVFETKAERLERRTKKRQATQARRAASVKQTASDTTDKSAPVDVQS